MTLIEAKPQGTGFPSFPLHQGDSERHPSACGITVVIFYEGQTGSEVTSWGWQPMEISLRKSFWLISIWLAGNFHPIDVRNNSELGTGSVINQPELPKKDPDLNLIHPKPRKNKYFLRVSQETSLHLQCFINCFFSLSFLACNEVIRCVIRCKTSSQEVVSE